MRLIYFSLLLLLSGCMALHVIDPEAQVYSPGMSIKGDVDSIPMLSPAALRTIPGQQWTKVDHKDTLAKYGMGAMSQDTANLYDGEPRESIISLNALIGVVQDSVTGGASQTLSISNDSLSISSGNTVVLPDSILDSLAIVSLGFTVGGHDTVTLAGTPDYITISGQVITRDSIDLANDVKGVLSQANFDTTGLTSGGGSDNLGNHNATQAIYVDSITEIMYLDSTVFIHSASGGKDGPFENLIIGYGAGDSLRASPDVEARANTLIGKRAGAKIKGAGVNEAVSNTLIGYQVAEEMTTGGYNTAIGAASLSGITTQDRNVAIGWHAMRLATSSESVGIGPEALENVTVGTNMALGYRALRTLTGGTLNTAMGHAAGTFQTGSDNTFVGANAGAVGVGAGFSNTFIGARSGQAMATGSQNTFIGDNAGILADTAVGNVIVGADAGAALTTGNNNIIMGLDAGNTVSTQSTNIFIGNQAGELATSANAVAIGQQALRDNTASGNVAVGSLAGTAVTSSSKNVFVGFRAGINQTGESNTWIGAESGEGSGAGAFNSGFGAEAGNKTTSGISNVFFGRYAGFNNTIGSNNVYIGTNSGETTLSGSYNIIIGRSTNPSSNTVSNELNIGNVLFGQGISNVRANGLASGQIGIGTDVPSTTLHVSGTATIDSVINLPTPPLLANTIDSILVRDNVSGDVKLRSASSINATHTGDVTGNTELTIAAKAVDVAMLADGTDGELITWDASGVAATVAVGTADQVLTSNGPGAAPTFQAAAGGGGGVEMFSILSQWMWYVSISATTNRIYYQSPSGGINNETQNSSKAPSGGGTNFVIGDSLNIAGTSRGYLLPVLYACDSFRVHLLMNVGENITSDTVNFCILRVNNSQMDFGTGTSIELYNIAEIDIASISNQFPEINEYDVWFSTPLAEGDYLLPVIYKKNATSPVCRFTCNIIGAKVVP